MEKGTPQSAHVLVVARHGSIWERERERERDNTIIRGLSFLDGEKGWSQRMICW